jgi:cobyrinic acid a,c-diamide synthase
VPFKVGPDYIDTSYHKFASGNFSYNLDIYMLGEDNVKKLFAKHIAEGDVAVVDGVMGLYDGINTTSYGSSAYVAKLLGIPVILVVEASGSGCKCFCFIKRIYRIR